FSKGEVCGKGNGFSCCEAGLLRVSSRQRSTENPIAFFDMSDSRANCLYFSTDIGPGNVGKRQRSQASGESDKVGWVNSRGVEADLHLSRLNEGIGSLFIA